MKKKILLFVFTSLLAFASVTVNATIVKDEMKAKVTAMTTEEKAARIEAIKARVMEIKEMDKSSLTSSERKALRKELRSMHYEAKAMGGGIYLSVGAIIIIILVLILIL